MLRYKNINKATLLLLATGLCSIAASASMQPAKLFAYLPDNCPTPDAFAIAPDGSLTLSCPNFANGKLQGELLSINTEGKVSHLATVPTLNLKKKANPMGIAYDENGVLYVADSRGIKQGRILRMTFDESQLKKTEVVASGINPNGLRYHNGAVYITQLKMPKIKSAHMTSGLYRFPTTARNLKMTNTLADKELIYTNETKNPDIEFGLDGLAFAENGDLYTANLGDSTVYRLTLNQNGKVVEQDVYAELPNTTRVDGIVFDQQQNLYLAGFGLNQIYKIDNKQEITKLADYADNNGSNGQIDQPADLIVFDNKLVISNFDLMKGKGLRNKKHGKPYTLSYIPLN